MKLFLRPLCASLLAVAVLSGCTTAAVAPAVPLEINLVGMNDFHGHLDASKFEYTSAADGARQSHLAGGVDNVAAALQAWRKVDRDLLFVGAGDLIGASPAMSAMWADEPSLNALTMAGMFASSVGNHEFDKGRAELLRQQNGGCVSTQPEKACQFAPDFRGAGFTYLAANVLDSATGKPFLPAWRIADVKGLKVGVIGAVLKDTASVVLASGITGLEFVDEADAINAVMPALRAQGASVFVLLIHEGGSTTEAFDKEDCSELKGPIVGIAKRLDPAIRLIISGHTHKGFQCKVDGRTITQAEMGGHVLSRINMKIDPATKAVLDIKVRNVVIKPGQYPPDEKVAAYLASARARSKEALAKPLARVAVRSMGRRASAAGETALGGVIADAFLAATQDQNAQIAFMNTGGIRKDLDVGENLTATVGQVQIVLPFGNTMVVMDLTGAQLRTVLEQQWIREGAAEPSVLQVSNGFTYRWDPARPPGQRVVPGSMKLNGVAIKDGATYRVTTNNFVAEGGDNFPVFKEARNKIDTHRRDFDVLVDYLVKHDKAGKPVGITEPAGRIQIVP
ncbi:bifunctional metallophosphatase/5'-nucleotidase [Massilia sp. PAMC28688]|uniref:bifunctional metallophosphatase/5'-nucleotidase n=1 Tax=Massilia sp. PAMC28688 TaxID=2861283 RepID=UPI001C62F88D|nr:bifunctional metallophosphatase/5'-nucleotidase [Massilia sp. PAMC28688]QYF94336.1 bifunctional metallophosphatase/5'-nucleotidase [Massilia sp. PAMC28688]